MTDANDHMSPDDFRAWLVAMRDAGITRSDAAAGRLLGWSANSVLKAKANGTDRRTALACQALLQRLEPYRP